MTMHSLVPTHFVDVLTFHYLSNNYDLMVVHDKPQGQQSNDGHPLWAMGMYVRNFMAIHAIMD